MGEEVMADVECRMFYVGFRMFDVECWKSDVGSPSPFLPSPILPSPVLPSPVLPLSGSPFPGDSRGSGGVDL